LGRAAAPSGRPDSALLAGVAEVGHLAGVVKPAKHHNLVLLPRKDVRAWPIRIPALAGLFRRGSDRIGTGDRWSGFIGCTRRVRPAHILYVGLVPLTIGLWFVPSRDASAKGCLIAAGVVIIGVAYAQAFQMRKRKRRG
jgi:hypothetical protein